MPKEKEKMNVILSFTSEDIELKNTSSRYNRDQNSSFDEDSGDEWFISSFLFGLHLPPLTRGKGEETVNCKLI
jgi:hypothetical protein